MTKAEFLAGVKFVIGGRVFYFERGMILNEKMDYCAGVFNSQIKNTYAIAYTTFLGEPVEKKLIYRELIKA